MLTFWRAVTELLTEVSCLTAGAGFAGFTDLAGMIAGSVGMIVLSLSVLTVALVQGGLLGLLLLVVLVPRGPHHQAGGLLDGHIGSTQLALAELEHLPAGLGHDDLGYSTPVAGEALDQQPRTQGRLYNIDTNDRRSHLNKVISLSIH